MGVNLVTLALAKKYVDEVIAGVAVIEGADCRIKSITKEGNKNIVTFEWERSDGTTTTSTMTVKDGATPTSVAVDDDNHIIFTMDDGTQLDGGVMPATDVAISKVANNKLVNKPDGLYVNGKIETIDNDLTVNGTVAATIFAAADSITSNGKDVAVVDDIPQISEETGNAIIEKDDGWFVPTSGSEVDNLTVTGDLNVSGFSTFSGGMQANTSSDFYDTVIMHNDATIESLTVNDTSTFNNDVTIDANLTLTGTGYLTADTVEATTEVIANSAQVSNDFSVGGTTTLTGETTVNDKFTVANSAEAELTGNVSINGTLTVSQSSVFYDDVTIDGDTVIEHNLNVTGDTIFALTPKVNKDDNWVEVAVVNDIPKISEEDGNAIVKKDDGWYVASSSGTFDDLEATGTLTVGGTSKFNNSVTVDGDVTLEGTSNFTADTINANTELNAKDVSISNTLGVTNDVTIGGSVTIDADSTINADLTVTGGITLNEDLDMTGGTGDVKIGTGRSIKSGTNNYILPYNDDNGDMELTSPNNIKITSTSKGVNINSATDSVIQTSEELHLNGSNGVYLHQENESDNSQLYLDTDGWFGVDAKEQAKVTVYSAGDIEGNNHTLAIDGNGLTYDGKEIPTSDKVMTIPEYTKDSIMGLGSIYAAYNWTFFKNLGFSSSPFPYGRDVWTDGERTYLSMNQTTAYVWDTDTNAWSPTQIPITNANRFYGRSVFEYNGDIYYSDSEGAAKFNRSTHMFERITFKYSGSKPFNTKALYGEKMFVLNGELYFSHNVNDYVYSDTYSTASKTQSEVLKLSSDGVTWVDADFGIPLFPSGEYAWVDIDGRVVIGNRQNYYRYNNSTNTFEPVYIREKISQSSTGLLRTDIINGVYMYYDDFGNAICSKGSTAYVYDQGLSAWQLLPPSKYAINGDCVFKTVNGLTLMCATTDKCYMYKPGITNITDLLPPVATSGRFYDLIERPSVRIPARLVCKTDKVNVCIWMALSAENHNSGQITIVDENDSRSGKSYISIYDLASSHFDNWGVYPGDECMYPCTGYWLDAQGNKHIALYIRDLDYGDDEEKTGDEDYNDYFEFTVEAQDGALIDLYCDFHNSETDWCLWAMT